MATVDSVNVGTALRKMLTALDRQDEHVPGYFDWPRVLDARHAIKVAERTGVLDRDADSLGRELLAAIKDRPAGKTSPSIHVRAVAANLRAALEGKR